MMLFLRALFALGACLSFAFGAAAQTPAPGSANMIWRDYAVAGVATSGLYNPHKADIRTWGSQVETGLSALAAGQAGGAYAFDTRADLNAFLSPGPWSMASVFADGTPANNGIYYKIGAAGSGSWSRLSGFIYGLQPTFSVGAVTSVSCSTAPAVSIGGTSAAVILNFNIPVCGGAGGVDAATLVGGPIPSGIAATTQSATDNSNKLATTAFVQSAINPTHIPYQNPLPNSAPTTLADAMYHWQRVSVKEFGPVRAKGDVLPLHSLSYASGSTLVCDSIDAPFTMADVGKQVRLDRFGPGGTRVFTTWASYVSPSCMNAATATSVPTPNSQTAYASTTANNIAAGFATWTVAASLPFAPGQTVTAYCGTPASYSYLEYGVVQSYSGASLTVNVTNPGAWASSPISCSAWSIVILPGWGLYGTDDCAALSNAAITTASSGITLVFPRDTGDYFTSCTVDFAPTLNRQNVIANTFGDQYDHLYAPSLSFTVESPGRATIIALGSLSGDVVALPYAAVVDPTKNNPASWKAVINDLGIDGSDVATNCLHIYSMREMRIDGATISNCFMGVDNDGVYGGQRITSTGFYGNTIAIGGTATGDSEIDHNTIFVYSNRVGSGPVYGILPTGWSGDTRIIGNVFSSNRNSPFSRETARFAIWIEGAADPSKTARDYAIIGNEGMGDDAFLYCNGAPSNSNAAKIKLIANHNIPDDIGYFSGTFAQLHYCDDVDFVANDMGMEQGAATSNFSLVIYNSRRWSVIGGTIANSLAPAIYVNNGDQGFIGGGLRLVDVAKYSTSVPLIQFVGVTRTIVNGVNAVQNYAGYGTTFVTDDAASSNNGASANSFLTPASTYTKYDAHGTNDHLGTLN